MWMMLQQDEPDDYVIATGTSYSIKDFCQLAFQEVGLDWAKYVELDNRYLRPLEVENLQGDSTKSWRKLGWKAKTLTPELVKIMVKYDLEKS